MNTSAERILLVESDPDITDLIAHQALQPLGYQVQVVGDVNSAITQAAQSAPDLVIADLNLPGLSGKDLLVAFNSQGFAGPGHRDRRKRPGEQCYSSIPFRRDRLSELADS